MSATNDMQVAVEVYLVELEMIKAFATDDNDRALGSRPVSARKIDHRTY